jgi:hypothetical protein
MISSTTFPTYTSQHWQVRNVPSVFGGGWERTTTGLPGLGFEGAVALIFLHSQPRDTLSTRGFFLLLGLFYLPLRLFSLLADGLSSVQFALRFLFLELLRSFAALLVRG